MSNLLLNYLSGLEGWFTPAVLYLIMKRSVLFTE